MPNTLDLSAFLDKAHEELGLSDLLAAPVSALAGITEADADLLQQAFNIKTVGDLGRNKYFRAAQALTLLADGGGK